MVVSTSRTSGKIRFSIYKSSIVTVCIIIFALLFSVYFFIYDSELISARHELHIWFFDVGQGDAIFITTPQGKQILVDGGPSSSVLKKLEGVMWPWDRSIDAIIITHPDADHVSGLVDVLERYEVDMIYETGARNSTLVSKALDEIILTTGTRQEFVEFGDEIKYDDLKIKFLFPDEISTGIQVINSNDFCVVAELVYNNTQVLLTGDITQEQEGIVSVRSGDIDILKVAHHGSASSTGSEFLRSTKPEFAVISVGENNKFGHPSFEVIHRLTQQGSELFRTDLDGDILLRILEDGYRIKAKPLTF
ncbi:MAG: MBL fold metallo-hydrolase [Patescibacteria group bacterium]